MIRVHPAVDIWSREGAERFVGDLRRVDPDVTGPPITSFEAIRFIRTGYLEGTLYALVLVIAISAAYLGSARGTVLALIPLGLGVLWTLGLMPVLGLEFNLANVTRDPDQPMIIQGSWPTPPTMTDYAIARSRVERVDSATLLGIVPTNRCSF